VGEALVLQGLVGGLRGTGGRGWSGYYDGSCSGDVWSLCGVGAGGKVMSRQLGRCACATGVMMECSPLAFLLICLCLKWLVVSACLSASVCVNSHLIIIERSIQPRLKLRLHILASPRPAAAPPLAASPRAAAHPVSTRTCAPAHSFPTLRGPPLNRLPAPAPDASGAPRAILPPCLVSPHLLCNERARHPSQETARLRPPVQMEGS
jgi:hypothetical protein